MATALPYYDPNRALSSFATMPDGQAIGRRPPINMGMAQEVPRTALPPPSNLPGSPAPNSLAARSQIVPAQPGMGQNPAKFMGMADVVQPQRLAAPSVPAAPGLASRALSGAARFAGPAAGALGIAAEGQQVLNVARAPGSTGLDVAAQAAQGAGRLGAAGAGAAGGAALGAMTGPLAPVAVPLGAIAGGALGYFSADRAIAGGRSLAEQAMSPGAPPAGGVAQPNSGGAVFGVFPQMPAGGTDANAPTQAQVRSVDNGLSSTGAVSGGGWRPPVGQPQVPDPANPNPATLSERGNVTDLGGWSAPAADRIAQLNRDAAFRREMTTREQQQRIASGQEMAPGLVAIDGAGAAADARQRMFDEANMRTVLARGAPPGRNGAQVFAQQVQGAAMPLVQRAQQQETDTQQAGATQRAQLAERGLAARAAMTDARQQEANSIDRARLGIDAIRASTAGLPAGYRMKADGSGLEYIPGGPADPITAKGKNNLNDTQAKALQFGTRMQQAGLTLDRLAAGGVNQPGLIKRGLDTVGLGAVGNFTQSPEQQQVEQAQRDFVNATLRRESGAAISESEFANARQQYFPQPGDSPAVIEQKRKNRELATQGFLAEVPDSANRVQQVLGAAGRSAPAAGTAGNAAAPSLPAGMSRQVGTSGGKPVYEDAQGRRFIGG